MILKIVWLLGSPRMFSLFVMYGNSFAQVWLLGSEEGAQGPILPALPAAIAGEPSSLVVMMMERRTRGGSHLAAVPVLEAFGLILPWAFPPGPVSWCCVEYWGSRRGPPSHVSVDVSHSRGLQSCRITSRASLGEMQSLVMSSQKALTREALKKKTTIHKPNKTAQKCLFLLAALVATCCCCSLGWF